MKVGDKVVVTEDGIGHYLKKPSIAVVIAADYHKKPGHVLVEGKAEDNGGKLQQYLTPSDYEVIEEDVEIE